MRERHRVRKGVFSRPEGLTAGLLVTSLYHTAKGSQNRKGASEPHGVVQKRSYPDFLGWTEEIVPVAPPTEVIN